MRCAQAAPFRMKRNVRRSGQTIETRCELRDCAVHTQQDRKRAKATRMGHALSLRPSDFVRAPIPMLAMAPASRTSLLGGAPPSRIQSWSWLTRRRPVACAADSQSKGNLMSKVLVLYYSTYGHIEATGDRDRLRLHALEKAQRPMKCDGERRVIRQLGSRPFKNYLSNCGIVAIGPIADAHAMGQPHRRWPFQVPVATSNPRATKCGSPVWPFEL
jgi:hypothetical protein